MVGLLWRYVPWAASDAERKRMPRMPRDARASITARHDVARGAACAAVVRSRPKRERQLPHTVARVWGGAPDLAGDAHDPADEALPPAGHRTRIAEAINRNSWVVIAACHGRRSALT